VNLLSWLRKSAPKTCRCGHSPRAHEHYTAATNCALCGCKRWRGRRCSATELADLSGDDIPEWPYGKPSAEWDRTWALLEDPLRPEDDPCVVRPRNPHQGERQ